MNISSSKKVTVATLQELKARGEKIACLTAYDYSFAAMLDGAGMDMIMVGDSLGMVIQGHETCLPVTLEALVYHTKCVSRGTSRALLISDLPFGCYQLGPEQACESAIRVMQDGGAEVVKLEGGVHMTDTIEFLTTRGIPVCAHIGLTPQSVHSLGGFRVQGRGDDAAFKLREDAAAVEDAGASMVVLEAMPASLAKDITAALSIPTIGIGAGADCDGQVLVLQDAIGIYPRKSPKFCRNFMDDTGTVKGAVTAYIEAVKTGTFPAEQHTFN